MKRRETDLSYQVCQNRYRREILAALLKSELSDADCSPSPQQSLIWVRPEHPHCSEQTALDCALSPHSSSTHSGRMGFLRSLWVCDS